MEPSWIACNACGADDFAPNGTVDGWTIGRCRACGLVYVNPVPFFEPADEFSEMSRGFEYTEYMHHPITPGILAFERQQLLANVAEVARLRGHALEVERPVRFLDVGCGSGASVGAASGLGWDAIGIDLDPQLIAEGREQLKVDLRCERILDSDLPPGWFDFIKLRDVIEHLPDPLEVLGKLRELLAPDGIILVVTPNEGGLPTRARLFLRQRHTLVATGRPPHHLHSFTPRTLALTMRRAGLGVRTTFTTTPSDGRYVTSHNVARADGRPLLRPVWRVGQALGMGSMLVAWAGRSDEAAG